jgi:voltage-gated potassium channel
MQAESSKSPSPGYQFFMLLLCLYALGVLAAQTVVRLEPQTRSILDYTDGVVCAFFLLDFGISLFRAPDRWKYFITWGWLDLLSSIPTIDIARWGRAARVLRVFRVLRGLRATKLLASLVLRRRAESTFLAASLVALLLVTFCSIAVLHFETEPESNIKTAGDAMWWAVATVTTVGYGDRYPITGEGRFIAAILMAAGVGLFGTFSGFLAAWFLGSEETESQHREIARLRVELAGLRDLLERALLQLQPRGASDASRQGAGEGGA